METRNITLNPQPIPSEQNYVADTLSRSQDIADWSIANVVFVQRKAIAGQNYLDVSVATKLLSNSVHSLTLNLLGMPF